MTGKNVSGTDGPATPPDQLIDITYYTDPLCCWSWAFEREWIKLLDQYKTRIRYRYVMGGLLPAWNNFHDPLHAVSRPAQLGPVWMHAQQATGVDINHRIWVTDPPASSYPSCIAVKCAGLQSFTAGELYLRAVSAACMRDGINIAKQEALIEVAVQVAKEHPGILSAELFADDLQHQRGYEPFRQDLHETQTRQIARFPTLIIRSAGKKTVMVAGYRNYDALTAIISEMGEKNGAAAPVS